MYSRMTNQNWWRLGVVAVWMAASSLITPASADDTMQAKTQKSTVDADGAIHFPAFTMPFSSLASEEAKRNFLESKKTTIQSWEEKLKRITKQRIEAFPATIRPQMIGGVQTNVIIPGGGIATKNTKRVLINLHSGGFISGTASDNGLLESVPIASLGRIKIVTVGYRHGPEHQFPAASEDVAAVYKELLKQYRAENIGIYGCSAGGILTAEAVAWFQMHQLPRPGAAGIFGAGAMSATRGDLLYLALAQSGGMDTEAPLPPRGTHVMDPYFGSSDIKDPMASPVYWPAILAKFPPTLVITRTRDVEGSDAIYTHTQLVKASVDADLHVWEGMGHCFFNYDADEPESREAYDVIVKFFDKHLGK